MDNFKAGRHIPVDTSDYDALEDFAYGGAFLGFGIALVGAVVCLIYLLIR